MAEITLRTDLSELATLAEFVERFSGQTSLPVEVAFQLALVLEELVTNAIGHGGAQGTIALRVERHGDTVEVEMVDAGAAFDPRTLPPPDLEAPLEERQIGGLGIFLVRQFIDEIEYRREADRNHLRLRKRLNTRRPSGAGDQRG